MESLFLLKTLYAVFTVYGITQIITEAKIFAWLRTRLSDTLLGDLVNCFLCTSVWVSFVFSYFVYSLASELFDINFEVANVFLDGMFLSALVWFFYVIESKLSR